MMAPDGGMALALVRGCCAFVLLCVAGGSVFAACMLRGASLEVRVAVRRLLLGGCVAGLTLLAAWVALQAADFADAGSLRAMLAALPDTAGTRFGQIAAGQAACLALTALLLAARRGPGWLSAMAASGTLLGQGLHAHAAQDGALALAIELAHLLAAACWLGALPSLLLAAALSPGFGAARLAARFSSWGMVWVAVLLASIVGQYRQMIGDPVALVATPYGRLALVKAALFAAMLGLAWLNRNRLVPLAGSRRGRVALLASIGAEAGLGLLAVLTAGWLAQTMPANHMQPVWPFGWRPSLSAVREDADIAWEVASAGWLLLLAAMLLLAALRLRGARRLVALVGAPLLVAAAWPHLDVLVVPADRNSFAVSPTGFAASSILAGASVYARNCASCHGAGGHGDGAGAAGLPVPPADLTAPHLWAHADGELFGWISDGIRAPDGRQAMPGFAGVLSPGQRWAVIDFIRARNAGGIAAQGGSWTVPVQAPPMRVACADGDMTLARLAAGGWVRLAFGAAPPSVLAGARLVWMDEDATAQPGRCAARQTGLASAYAILSGVSPQDLEAAQILVDPQGRLRAIAPRGWHDPASLERAMETLSKVAPRLPDPASMTGMGPMQGMKM